MPKPAKLNFIESAIGEVAPKWAFRRLQSKQALALAGGGFSGASRVRASLRDYNPAAGDAASDINPDLEVLRARSRDLGRSAMLAVAAIKSVVSHAVGTGLSYQSRIDGALLKIDDATAAAWQDQTERRYRLWCESRECDITRTQNFYGLQAMVLQSLLESGDILVMMVDAPRPNAQSSMALQTVEADRICNPNFSQDTDSIVAGISFDEYGAPARYHVSRYHPGAVRMRASQKWQTVEAYGARSGRRNALHIFHRTRPGQVRGVPFLAPVIEALKQLSRYTEAELQAAVINGVFAVFMRMDPSAFNELFDDNERKSYIDSAAKWDGGLKFAGVDNGGKAINLLPGEDPVNVTPGRPNPAFDPFFNAISSQIGAALEIPFEVLLKHFASSYSASRGALLDAWRFFMRMRDFIAGEFCQPVFEHWLDGEVAAGRIIAPGYFADALTRKAWCGSEWVGDGPGSLDPLKEINAAKERIAVGISTIAAESILHDGKDWEAKHRQRVREITLRRAAALEPEQAAATIPPTQPGDGDTDTD